MKGKSRLAVLLLFAFAIACKEEKKDGGAAATAGAPRNAPCR